MTSLTTDQPAAADTVLSPRRIGIAAVVAVLVNVAVYAIGDVAGATWQANGQEVAWFMVISATLIPFAIGGLITWALARKWMSAPRWMAWIGLVFAVVSLPMPFFASGDSTTALTLATMHVVAGIAWFVSVFPRAGSAQA
ncbi:MAG TPA: DUF6069 family protein [Actinomycetota bacterium]|nr:MAG: hypothetical protein E6Q90_11225 [Actinomycetota bacterium]HNE90015.1 DUF6069 family protein [Actinomycetota bacterium]HNL50796.1 DUF6069 family protein [Actinomycetota bacterium]